MITLSGRDAAGGNTYIKSLAILWEPLAMALNSTPSRLMSWGRHHSTMFPVKDIDAVTHVIMCTTSVILSSWTLPLIQSVLVVGRGQAWRESNDSATEIDSMWSWIMGSDNTFRTKHNRTSSLSHRDSHLIKKNPMVTLKHCYGQGSIYLHLKLQQFYKTFSFCWLMN